MKNAIVIDANEVKTILAEHFKVSADNVIKSQYSYIVITDKETAKEAENGSVG